MFKLKNGTSLDTLGISKNTKELYLLCVIGGSAVCIYQNKNWTQAILFKLGTAPGIHNRLTK